MVQACTVNIFDANPNASPQPDEGLNMITKIERVSYFTVDIGCFLN